MEKIKDIVLVGFAIVGFVSVLSSFSEQQVYGTPESHVWSFHINDAAQGWTGAFALNKQTGEVRKYEVKNQTPFDDKAKIIIGFDKYMITEPVK